MPHPHIDKRYVRREIPITPKEAQAERADKFIAMRNRALELRKEADALIAEGLLLFAPPLPTTREELVAVYPGDPGYDDAPPYIGEFKHKLPSP